MDLPAGVMVAILLVPQAIAYAYLAGMPPQYGLYTALVPCVLYAIFGTSPHLAIGPVAVSALLVMAGVSTIVEPFSERYVELVILAGLLIGFMQFLLGVLRLGSMVNLLSYPVLTGFTSAASIIVIVNQLKDIFGIQIPRSDFLFDTILHIGNNFNSIHTPTLLIGILTFLLIFIIKRISKKIPSGLVVVVLGITLSYILDFKSLGIAIIGEVPSGLPTFSLPQLDMASVTCLIPTVILVTIIGIIESVGIAKAVESKHEYYTIDTNQELRALGISKMAGAFFQSIPSSGSFSRSALLNSSGGRTTISSIVSVVFVIIALLFLTPLLYFLPKVILAVIIVFAVKNLFEYALAKSFYKTNKLDLFVMLVTFIFTIFINIEVGVILGFITSLFVILLTSKEKLTVLKNVLFMKDSEGIEFEHNRDNLTITIIDQVNFGNAAYLKKEATRILNDNQEITSLTFNFSKAIDIDSTGLKTMKSITNLAQSKEIKVQHKSFNDIINYRLHKCDLIGNNHN